MPVRLDLDRHLTVIGESGRALARAAHRAGWEAPVPTCPGWTVRELVAHQGMVHRWAAANLIGDKDYRPSMTEAKAVPDLAEWYLGGLEALVETFQVVGDDTKAMVFLHDAPPPRRFWARRQAHETTIHSVDALAAALGRWPTSEDVEVDSDTAVDGIDELLLGFLPRGKGKLRFDQPVTILVTATDADAAWTVRATADSNTASTGTVDDPDAVIAGTAADLYLGLWNRADGVQVSGRADVIERWREQVRVRWS